MMKPPIRFSFEIGFLLAEDTIISLPPLQADADGFH